MDSQKILAEIEQSIVSGDMEATVKLAELAIKNNMDLNTIIDKGFIPGIQKTGDLWEKGEYFLPELISSAECMKRAMQILEPGLTQAQIKSRAKAKIVIGTIEGDIHDIGKNLVSSLLSANGYDVIDLGADVKLQLFLDTAVKEQADFICLSSLLTTTMLGQKRFIELLSKNNMLERFKVLVGGAPVTQKWADDIGADGYAANALSAVQLVNNIYQANR